MPSAETRTGGGPNATAEDRRALLFIAGASIEHGLAHGEPRPFKSEDYEDALRLPGASFVTLTCAGSLRGCIGSLLPYRPLAQDLGANAYAAAFRDPRFRPLTIPELAQLTLELAILNPLEPMSCASEAELIAQLRPHTDGLVLEEGGRHRATFLPKVWEVLPKPEEFLHELRRKAGLTPDYWSDTLRFSRYTTRVVRGAYADAFDPGSTR